jgi:hypothetical protein
LLPLGARLDPEAPEFARAEIALALLVPELVHERLLQQAAHSKARLGES